MTNAEAFERTLAVVGDRLDEADEALVVLARGLAQAVDKDPGNASLAREYRGTLIALIAKAGAGDKPDDDTAEFLASISVLRPAVGHSKES